MNHPYFDHGPNPNTHNGVHATKKGLKSPFEMCGPDINLNEHLQNNNYNPNLKVT